MGEEVTHADLANQMMHLESVVAELAREVAATKDIVNAYQAMKTGSAFVAWLAKLIGGIMLLYVAWKVGPSAFGGVK